MRAALGAGVPVDALDAGRVVAKFIVGGGDVQGEVCDGGEGEVGGAEAFGSEGGVGGVGYEAGDGSVGFGLGKVARTVCCFCFEMWNLL